MDKKLKKLSRVELLELMISLSEDYQALADENNRLKKMLSVQRLPRSTKVGSIAEAALQANGYFTAAQRSADEYLREIKHLRDELSRRVGSQQAAPAGAHAAAQQPASQAQQAQFAQLERQAQERANQIVAHANAQAEAILGDARARAEETLANANRQSHAILSKAQHRAQAMQNVAGASAGAQGGGAQASQGAHAQAAQGSRAGAHAYSTGSGAYQEMRRSVQSIPSPAHAAGVMTATMAGGTMAASSASDASARGAHASQGYFGGSI